MGQNQTNNPNQSTLDSSKSSEPEFDLEAEREKIRAEERKKAEEAVKSERAKVDAEREELDAEKEVAKSAQSRAVVKPSAPKYSAKEQKALDMIVAGRKSKDGDNVHKIVAATGLKEKEVLALAYGTLHGESLYSLAHRLAVKVNDMYKAVGRKDMVRKIVEEEQDDDGTVRRKLKDLDYED